MLFFLIFIYSCISFSNYLFASLLTNHVAHINIKHIETQRERERERERDRCTCDPNIVYNQCHKKYVSKKI